MGSPIVMLMDKKWVQVGISSSINCNQGYDSFSKVSNFREFIDEGIAIEYIFILLSII